MTNLHYLNVNASYGEAVEENNPPLDLFPTLFDKQQAGKVASTVGEERFSISNTTSWKVRHVWLHQLGTTYFAEEAVLPYCHSSTNNPEHFSKVGKDMLKTQMAIASMFMTNYQGRDGVISWDDHLMLGGVRYRSILQTTRQLGGCHWSQ